MKYIIVNNETLQQDMIIIFPSLIGHNQMTKLMKQITLNKFVSAGFIDEFMKCYGSSEILGTSSRNEDTSILHKMLHIDDKDIKFKKIEVTYD